MNTRREICLQALTNVGMKDKIEKMTKAPG